MINRSINLEQGWDLIQEGIAKLIKELPEPNFSSEDYMMLYTTIYNMCTQKPPHDYSQQLYDKYRESFEEYIASTVMPCLREKHDEFMLRELIKRWLNHEVMVRWLSRFFHHLDRYFIPRRKLSGLKEVGLTCFRDLVYQELYGKIRDTVIYMIDQEQEGKEIDRALLKNVLDILVEIGKGQKDYHENHFEAAMLNDIAAYYSCKASRWLLGDPCRDYMMKAEECLKQAKDRVSHYLHSSIVTKLLEKMQRQLLFEYVSQLLVKNHSGCHAVLGNEKVLGGGFTYLYKFGNIMCLSQADKEDFVGIRKEVFLGNVIEAYENNCFVNHTLFHKVYQELNGKVRDAVISLIDQEREGEKIKHDLLKNALDIFVEIGKEQKDYYENHFEEAMLKETVAHYSRKASSWILDDSCSDYMKKAEKCLKEEKDRVSHYLHLSSEPKLLEKVQHELLSVYAFQLLEKEHSGYHALLRDNMVEDLSRMYKLFSKIPRGLEPVAKIFKQVLHWLNKQKMPQVTRRQIRKMLSGYWNSFLLEK